MKVNAKRVLKNLKGENYQDNKEDVTVGAIVSNILSQEQTGGKMKLYSLAVRFYEDEEVELDSADLVLVKKAVEDSKEYNNLILGQILLALEGE